MLQLPVRTALGVLALTLAAPAARAVDGTITINGEIIESTCKINGDTPPKDFIVNLPKISTTALKRKGDTAGATLFTLTLTDCPSSLPAGEVRAHFEPGITTDYGTGALHAYTSASETSTTAASSIPADRGTAKKADNVQIQIANADGSAIMIGASDSKAKGAPLQNGSGSTTKTATLHYLARYYKSGDGAVSSGRLVTYVNYSIVYP